jgi:periplasmic protein CpxP/Spy
MKRTLTGLLAVGGLVLLCGSISPARAQGAEQSQASPEQQQNEPNRPDLNLSDDQKAQMKKIHEDAKSQIDAVKNDSSLSDGQKQAKIQQIHQGTRKQVEAILTPEQKKEMREWRREHKGSRQQQTPPPSN